MFIGIHNCDEGIVYGRITLIDFILCYISAKKDDYLHRRWFTLHPIEGYPFYKDYERLIVPCEEMIFKFMV